MEERLRILLNVLVNELFNMVDITGVAIIVTQMLLRGLESTIHYNDEDIDDATEYWIEDEIVTWCYQFREEEQPKECIEDCKTCMALIEYKDFLNIGQDENNNNLVPSRNKQSWNSNVNKSSLLYNVSWIGFFHQDVKRETKIAYRIKAARQGIYTVVSQNENGADNTTKDENEVNNVDYDEVIAEDIYIWDYEDYDLEYDEQIHEENAVNIFTEFQDVMEVILDQTENKSEKDTKNKINEQKEKEQYHQEEEEHDQHHEEKEVELIFHEIKTRIQNHLEHNAKYTLYKASKRDYVNHSAEGDRKDDKENECECTIQSNDDKVEDHTVYEHNQETKNKEDSDTSSSKVIKEEIMPVLDTKFTVGEPLDINVNYLESKSKSFYLQIPFTSNFKNRTSLTDCKTENSNGQPEKKFDNGCTHVKSQKHCKVANCRSSVFQRKSELKRASLTTIKIQDMKNENNYPKTVISSKVNQKCIVSEVLKHKHANSEQDRDIHFQFSPKHDHKRTVPEPFQFDNHNKENLPNQGPFIPELKHQHTMPKPFELIEKHDSELQARKQAKLHALLEEEQKKLECESIKIRPAPHFGTPFKPKLSHKCTQPKPFGFLERPSKTDRRIKGDKRTTAR